MTTNNLQLERDSKGYYRTRWYDDNGKRQTKGFGKHKAKAVNAFNRFRAEWLTAPKTRTPDTEGPLTLRAAWALYFEHAKGYYCHADGTPTGEADNIEDAFNFVLELYGDEPAASFTSLMLETVQGAMLKKKHAVSTINKRIDRIRNAIKWISKKRLIPASVWHETLTVEAVKNGRAVEVDGKFIIPVQPPKVKEVPVPYINQVLSHLPPTLAAMVCFGYWTGARPGETCRLTTGQIDMSGEVWTYRPGRHKTTHHGKERVVLIGPQAQDVIRPFLKTDLSAALFSPAQTMKERAAMKQAAYDPKEAKSPGDYRTWPSYLERKANRQDTGRYRDFWDARAFCRAVAKVCDDHEIPRWSPNKLRHSAGTRVRKAEGLEATQVILGHADIATTQIYAGPDLEGAINAVKRVG